MRAVITGATGGIGGATAEALGRAGYEATSWLATAQTSFA